MYQLLQISVIQYKAAGLPTLLLCIALFSLTHIITIYQTMCEVCMELSENIRNTYMHTAE
jgi:hypothetical protein